MTNISTKEKAVFSRYEKFLIAILAILQFTIILDFMILAPLGEQLIGTLSIGGTGKIATEDFGLVVSAYAISAGISAFLAAGFADRFDRKKMLLFFYAGFIIGTLFCGLAPTYEYLLAARIFTGIFGGVMGSVVMAIVTDIFDMKVRGRVMGFVQMAFAASQVLGIPLGLFLSINLDWHAPFLLIVALSIIVFIFIIVYLRPVDKHLHARSDKNPFLHLWHTIQNTEYVKGFGAMMLLATGGFMMMPFGTKFAVGNLGITRADTITMSFVSGLFTIFAGPLAGRLSDKIGKYPLFFGGSALTAIVVVIYCYLEITPLWMVILINVIMMIGITARMISASALISGIPKMQDRGAFMAINSSVQYLSGGVAAFVAGQLVTADRTTGYVSNYPTIGWVVVVATSITMILMFFINQMLKKKHLKVGAGQTLVSAEK